MRKLISIAAVFVILASSTGTTIAMHFCGKSLQSVAVFAKAKSCCPDIDMPSGCCHNEKIEINSDNFNVAQPISNLGFESFLIREISFPVIDFTAHFKNSQSNLSNSFLSNSDHAHPPSNPDIVILIQSFLI